MLIWQITSYLHWKCTWATKLIEWGEGVQIITDRCCVLIELQGGICYFQHWGSLKYTSYSFSAVFYSQLLLQSILNLLHVWFVPLNGFFSTTSTELSVCFRAICLNKFSQNYRWASHKPAVSSCFFQQSPVFYIISENTWVGVSFTFSWS